MAEGGTEIRTYTVKAMCNIDLAGLVERIDETIYEISKSQSEGLLDIRIADRSRLDQYNNRLERYMEWMYSEPQVDSPESHPSKNPITYISETEDDDSENKALRDLIRQYRVMMTEMAHCASNRMPNSISNPDKARFDASLAKIRSFLTNYLDDTQPVDMPEGQPSSSQTTHGFGGS